MIKHCLLSKIYVQRLISIYPQPFNALSETCWCAIQQGPRSQMRIGQFGKYGQIFVNISGGKWQIFLNIVGEMTTIGKYWEY